MQRSIAAMYLSFPNFWIKENGTVHRNPQGPLPDIRDQAWLDFECADYPRITELKRGFIEVMATRGCPYRCAYCQNHAVMSLYGRNSHGPKYSRQRDVENLLGEILRFREAVGERARAVMFADDTLTTNKAWLREFCSEYPRKVDLPFVGCAMPNQVGPDVARMLRSAGCNMVKFGAWRAE